MKQGFLISTLVFFLATGVAPAAVADQLLATSRNCMTCHMVDKKILGPAFKEVAIRYKGDKGAADRLATKIIQGGSGAWGTAYMPKNAQVTEAEARKLAAWILSLK
nr:c-type cytochrome [uncultured Rhodoferax sp.]